MSTVLEDSPQFVPPGHFYSPIPSLAEIKARESIIFDDPTEKIADIALQADEQSRLLKVFGTYYNDLPFEQNDLLYGKLQALTEAYHATVDPGQKQQIYAQYERLIQEQRPTATRYFYDNPNYGYSDGVVYYCMLRHLRPKRVIEIGAGYSTALLLDTNERQFNGTIECITIDPYTETLSSVIRDSATTALTVINARVQDVDTGIFTTLEKNDVLFVDTSHVSKVFSDVNHILFTILPLLASGVHIHFHDIFWPFEYPKKWIYEGRCWNEIYLLRAFLANNDTFSISFFTSYMQKVFGDEIRCSLPLVMRGEGGSLWLRKH